MDGDAIIGRIYVQATITYFHERVHRHVSALTNACTVSTGSKEFEGSSARSEEREAKSERAARPQPVEEVAERIRSRRN